MIRFLLFVLLHFPVFAINQKEAEAFVSEGNRLFGEKNFSEAIQNYQEALQFNFSAQIFFNMGQCYYALQKPGFALAYYLKAKNIEPRWKLLNDAIDTFYQQNPDIVHEIFPWYHSLFCYFQWNTWILLTTIFLCGSVCLFTYYKIFCHKKSVLLSSLGLFLLFVLGTSFIVANYSFKNLYICPETVPVLFAPTGSSPERYSLSAGRQCTIKLIQTDYCFINTLDNKDGWVKRASLISL